MKRFSVFAVAREAMRQHNGWGRTWSNPEPKKSYEVIIVGQGAMDWPLPTILVKILELLMLR